MHRLSFGPSFARLSLALLALGGLAARPASAQNLFVGANGYIEQFSHSGTDLGVFYKDPIGNHMGHTSGLIFDAGGNLLIISNSTYGIVKVSPTGAYLANIGAGASYSSVAADAFGNIYAANPNKHEVDKFFVSGAPSEVYLSAADGITTPSGLAFDKSGNLYVSNAQRDGKTLGAYLNKITEYAPDKTSLGIFATPRADFQAQSIAFNNAGNLFVGGFNDVGRAGDVQQFSSTGGNLGSFPHFIDGTHFGLYDPIQFAFDAAGNVLVDDTGGLFAFNSKGNPTSGPTNIAISASGVAFAPFAPTPVPEAATTTSLGLLLLLGLGGLAVSRRRSRKGQGVSATRL